MEDIRRTDTCLVRLFYSVFHHQRLVSVESNYRLIPQITQGKAAWGLRESVGGRKAHIHAIYLRYMYVSSALCTVPGPKLSGWAHLHYIMLPAFLCGTATRLILIWLFLRLISFCLRYQHTNISRYCILHSIFAAFICFEFNLRLMGTGLLYRNSPWKFPRV